MKGTTTVYLIRHGEVKYEKDEQGKRLIYGPHVPLSLKGREQVRKLSLSLTQETPQLDILFTSPYTRAQQSAEIAEKILKPRSVFVRENLRDVWCPGWVGVSLEELQRVGGDIYAAPPRSADQETLDALTNRVTKEFSKIAQEAQGKKIGVVSHGDAIRMIIYRLLTPEGSLPGFEFLAAHDYIQKGCAWKLLLSDSGSLIEKSIKVGEGRAVRAEKDY